MMKKHGLRKIIASLSLSALMFASVGVAAGNLSNDYAKASTSVTLSSYASSIAKSDGATVESGSYSYTPNTNNQWTTNGVKLTGGAGATFSLGTIDISKGSWNGTETTVTGDYTSFIDFWYLPSVANLGKTSGELRSFTITLTDKTDSSNYLNIEVLAVNNGSGNDVMYFKAQATGQNTSGAYRAKGTGKFDGQFNTGSYITKSHIYEATNKTTGRGTTAEDVYPTGVQSQGISLVYSKTTNTLYSPIICTATTGLQKSYAIRNFAETYTDGVTSSDATWSGFKGDLVNVSIKFNSLKSGTTSTSLVISSLGGTTLADNITVEDGDYIVIPADNTFNDALIGGTQTINVPYQKYNTFVGYVDNATVSNRKVEIYKGSTLTQTVTEFENNKCTYTYDAEGVYTFKISADGMDAVSYKVNVVSDKYKGSVNDIISNFTTSDTTATVSYGSKSLHNTAASTTSYSGIVLTGGAGATFTYSKPVNLSNFKYNSQSDYDSFIGFVITPRDTTKATVSGNQYNTEADAKAASSLNAWNGREYFASELTGLTITLTDATDSSKFIKFNVTSPELNEDRKDSVNGFATSTATGLKNGIYRQKQDDVLNKLNAQAPKQIGFTGNAVASTELIYDYSKNALYGSPKSVHSATGTSDLIRDFDTLSIYDVNAIGDNATFSGFTDGNVYISITFDGLFDVTSPRNVANAYGGGSYNYTCEQFADTSIVLTSLMGYDLSTGNFLADPEDDVIKAEKSNYTLYYGEKLTLPEITRVHPYSGALTYSGTYEVLDTSGSKVNGLGGTYSAGSEIEFANIGKYTVRATDIFGRTTDINVTVHPVLTVNLSSNITAIVNGTAVKNGDILKVSDSLNFELTVAKGYNLDFALNNTALSDVLSFTINYDVLTANENVLTLNTQAIIYNITYKMFEDDTYSNTGTFTADSILDGTALLTAPQVEGKAFIGWYLNGVKLENAKNLPYENVVLYGAYGNPTYTVTFNLDGSTQTQQVAVNGKPVAYVPVKDGYTFGGWYSDEACNTKYSFDAEITADTTIYAKWTRIETVNGSDVSVTEPTINATLAEAGSNVNALQIVFIVIGAIGILGLVGVGALLLVKKYKKN